MIHVMILFLLVVSSAFVIYCLAPTLKNLFVKKASDFLEKTEKSVMLSFDDGPDPRYTPRLLNILKENGVRAIFFVVAEKAAQHPELIREIASAGHLIGLHSLKHRDAWLATPADQKKDFEQGLAILERLGCSVSYYRAPWGHLTLTSLSLAKKHELSVVLWTVMAQDWEKESTSGRILERLLKRAKSGSVICLHDSGCDKGAAPGAPEHTLKAVSEFIPAMQSSGYRFVLPADCAGNRGGCVR